MSSFVLSHDDPVSRYADDVLSGRVVAGEFVKAACRRHFADLEHGGKRGLTFDAGAADRALRFFPAVLTVTDGAAAGQPFTPLRWHEFVVGSLFGWKRSDGLRRFRQAWIETGKGQAKSPLMGGLGLFMLGFYGLPRPQIFAIANDKDQANVLFRDAVAMCRATIPGHEDGETLESEGHVIIRGVGDNAWKIEHPASGGFFRPIASSESNSGPRPSLVLADEIHEMRTAKPLQLWKAAIDKMSGDPLMILGTNTPATDQIVGTEWSGMAQRVVTGQADDDATFAFIARVDKSDDPMGDESCWPKSLPALGVTFPIENVRSRVAQARLMLSEALATKRLYFGIPVGSTEFWISESAWQSAQGEVDEADMLGKPCWLSLDLSKKNDLTALSACWATGEGRHAIKTWYFTTRDNLAERERDDKAPYAEWAAAGFIDAVPGAVIDYEFVAERVRSIFDRHDVRLLAFDSAKIGDFIAACDRIEFPVWKYEGQDKPAGDGLKMVAHAQGTRVLFRDCALSMPTSVVAFEDAILEGRVTIDRSPVSMMCASNACVVADAMNNRAFDKKRSRGRIDGIVTMAMAIGAASAREGMPEMSYLETGSLAFV